MPTTTIDFDGPGFPLGAITATSSDGISVRFLTRTVVYEPGVPTRSGTRAVMNAQRERLASWGRTPPMLVRLDPPMRFVALRVGLDDADPEGQPTTALLTAHDEFGVEIVRDSVVLGSGPRAITQGMVVEADSDRIATIRLQFDRAVVETFDRLQLAWDGTGITHVDVVAPAVTILEPASGSRVFGNTVSVSGVVDDLSDVTLRLNGTVVATERIDVGRHLFAAPVTLADGRNTITATATDATGNVGVSSIGLERASPAVIEAMALHLTQSGLLPDDLTAAPEPRVAGKSGVVRVRLRLRTADGRPSGAERVELAVIAGGRRWLTPGLRVRADAVYPTVSGGETIEDGQWAYFFVRGEWLPPDVATQFVLRVFTSGAVVRELTLMHDVRFQRVPPMTMLLVPQVRPFRDDQLRQILRMLEELARIYPVADGVAGLASAGTAGVRFAIAGPVSFRGHEQAGFGPYPPFEETFLLTDRLVATGAIEAAHVERLDTPIDAIYYAGEFLALSGLEDGNRDGRFGADDRATLTVDGSFPGRLPTDTESSPWKRRTSNLVGFMVSQAEARRQAWNASHPPDQRAWRAVALLTYGEQNRQGWLGQGAFGAAAFWSSIGAGMAASVAHELGHTLRFPHTDDEPRPGEGSCTIAGTSSLNLLTRRSYLAAESIMCSAIDDPQYYFLLPGQYRGLFERFTAGETVRVSRDRASRDAATFTAVGLVEANGLVELLLTGVEPARPNPEDGHVIHGRVACTLALVDASGATLVETPLLAAREAAPVIPCGPPGITAQWFAASLPVADDAAGAEVRLAGKPIAAIPRSQQPPVISEFEATLQPEAQQVSLRWVAKSPAGRPLTFALAVSVDGERRIPLDVGLTSDRLDVPLQTLPVGLPVQFTLRASDGWLSEDAWSGPMTLPNRLPVACILEPRQHRMVHTGDGIYLRGRGLDAGFGMLEGKALTWTLDSQDARIQLGTGSEVWIPSLPPGAQTITLTVVDRHGATGDDHVLVIGRR